MKTNGRIVTLAAILAGMVMLGNPAAAQQGGQQGKRAEKMIEKLNLTPDQQTKIKAIREQFKSQNATSIAEIKTLRNQMKQQMQNKDKDGAKATRDQIKAKMEAMKPAREQMRSQIEQILTPEQRSQLATMKQERKEKMQDRRQERRGKRGGNGSVK
jgi:protein CpxP